jgi:DNA-binding NtrC family response regulator
MPCEPVRSSPKPVNGARGTVLIVEDEVLIRFALADFLRDNRYKVYEAHDAEEAIKLLSFYKTDVDVVFADVRLPGPLDGFALAQWIQRYRPEAAVVLGSGYPVDVAGASLSDVLFFAKPYDLKAVRTALSDLMRQRREQP